MVLPETAPPNDVTPDTVVVIPETVAAADDCHVDAAV
jgi:hypothetical protein